MNASGGGGLDSDHSMKFCRGWFSAGEIAQGVRTSVGHAVGGATSVLAGERVGRQGAAVPRVALKTRRIARERRALR